MYAYTHICPYILLMCFTIKAHKRKENDHSFYQKKRGNKKSGFIMFLSAFHIWWVSSVITAKSWHRVNAEANVFQMIYIFINI